MAFSIEESPGYIEPHEFLTFDAILVMFGLRDEIRDALKIKEKIETYLKEDETELFKYCSEVPMDRRNEKYVDTLISQIDFLNI